MKDPRGRSNDEWIPFDGARLPPITTLPLDRIHYYDSYGHCYVVATDAIGREYRLLKFTKNDAYLDYHLDTTIYSYDEIQRLLDVLQQSKTLQHGKAHAILGCVRFTRGYYLLFINKRRRAGRIGPHVIYEVANVSLVSLCDEMMSPNDSGSGWQRPNASSGDVGGLDDRSAASKKSSSAGGGVGSTAASVSQTLLAWRSAEEYYLEQFRTFTLRRYMYYSHTYDLSNTLQVNMVCSQQKRRPRAKYVWNEFLLEPMLHTKGASPVEGAAAQNPYAARNPTTPGETPTSSSMPSPPSVEFGKDEDDVDDELRVEDEHWKTEHERESRYVFEPHQLVPWVVHVVHGCVAQYRVRSMSGPVTLSVIGRVSKDFSGARYLRRGVSIDGRVANHVEIEQVAILDDSLREFGTIGRFSSYVQVRGSVPVHWFHPPTQLPKPPIRLGISDPFYNDTRLHFQELIADYGAPVVVMNLLKAHERKRREMVLTDEFRDAVRVLQRHCGNTESGVGPSSCEYEFSHKRDFDGVDLDGESNGTIRGVELEQVMFGECVDSEVESSVQVLRYKAFDLRGNAHRAWNSMTAYAEEDFPVIGFFACDGEERIRLQHGVVRSNCVDCIDRTNLGQFFYGIHVLGHQLRSLGIVEDEIDASLSQEVNEAMLRMYLMLGDAIAIQYGGSAQVGAGLLHRGIGWDKIMSIKRMYNNAMGDREKQAALNLFLGRYQPFPSVFSNATNHIMRIPGLRAYNVLAGTRLGSPGIVSWAATAAAMAQQRNRIHINKIRKKKNSNNNNSNNNNNKKKNNEDGNNANDDSEDVEEEEEEEETGGRGGGGDRSKPSRRDLPMSMSDVLISQARMIGSSLFTAYVGSESNAMIGMGGSSSEAAYATRRRAVKLKRAMEIQKRREAEHQREVLEQVHAQEEKEKQKKEKEKEKEQQAKDASKTASPRPDAVSGGGGGGGGVVMDRQVSFAAPSPLTPRSPNNTGAGTVVSASSSDHDTAAPRESLETANPTEVSTVPNNSNKNANGEKATDTKPEPSALTPIVQGGSEQSDVQVVPEDGVDRSVESKATTQENSKPSTSPSSTTVESTKQTTAVLESTPSVSAKTQSTTTSTPTTTAAPSTGKPNPTPSTGKPTPAAAGTTSKASTSTQLVVSQHGALTAADSPIPHGIFGGLFSGNLLFSLFGSTARPPPTPAVMTLEEAITMPTELFQDYNPDVAQMNSAGVDGPEGTLGRVLDLSEVESDYYLQVASASQLPPTDRLYMWYRPALRRYYHRLGDKVMRALDTAATTSIEDVIARSSSDCNCAVENPNFSSSTTAEKLLAHICVSEKRNDIISKQACLMNSVLSLRERKALGLEHMPPSSVYPLPRPAMSDADLRSSPAAGSTASSPHDLQPTVTHNKSTATLLSPSEESDQSSPISIRPQSTTSQATPASAPVAGGVGIRESPSLTTLSAFSTTPPLLRKEKAKKPGKGKVTLRTREGTFEQVSSRTADRMMMACWLALHLRHSFKGARLPELNAVGYVDGPSDDDTIFGNDFDGQGAYELRTTNSTTSLSRYVRVRLARGQLTAWENKRHLTVYKDPVSTVYYDVTPQYGKALEMIHNHVRYPEEVRHSVHYRNTRITRHLCDNLCTDAEWRTMALTQLIPYGHPSTWTCDTVVEALLSVDNTVLEGTLRYLRYRQVDGRTLLASKFDIELSQMVQRESVERFVQLARSMPLVDNAALLHQYIASGVEDPTTVSNEQVVESAVAFPYHTYQAVRPFFAQLMSPSCMEQTIRKLVRAMADNHRGVPRSNRVRYRDSNIRRIPEAVPQLNCFSAKELFFWLQNSSERVGLTLHEPLTRRGRDAQTWQLMMWLLQAGIIIPLPPLTSSSTSSAALQSFGVIAYPTTEVTFVDNSDLFTLPDLLVVRVLNFSDVIESLSGHETRVAPDRSYLAASPQQENNHRRQQQQHPSHSAMENDDLHPSSANMDALDLPSPALRCSDSQSTVTSGNDRRYSSEGGSPHLINLMDRNQYTSPVDSGVALSPARTYTNGEAFNASTSQNVSATRQDGRREGHAPSLPPSITESPLVYVESFVNLAFGALAAYDELVAQCQAAPHSVAAVVNALAVALGNYGAADLSDDGGCRVTRTCPGVDESNAFSRSAQRNTTATADSDHSGDASKKSSRRASPIFPRPSDPMSAWPSNPEPSRMSIVSQSSETGGRTDPRSPTRIHTLQLPRSLHVSPAVFSDKDSAHHGSPGDGGGLLSPTLTQAPNTSSSCNPSIPSPAHAALSMLDPSLGTDAIQHIRTILLILDSMQSFSSYLQSVDLSALNSSSRWCFFVNVFNALFIHSWLTAVAQPSTEMRRFYFCNAYRIGGHTFTLDDIKNGILRGNKPSKFTVLPPFAPDDARIALIPSVRHSATASRLRRQTTNGTWHSWAMGNQFDEDDDAEDRYANFDEWFRSHVTGGNQAEVDDRLWNGDYGSDDGETHPSQQRYTMDEKDEHARVDGRILLALIDTYVFPPGFELVTSYDPLAIVQRYKLVRLRKQLFSSSRWSGVDDAYIADAVRVGDGEVVGGTDWRWSRDDDYLHDGLKDTYGANLENQSFRASIKNIGKKYSDEDDDDDDYDDDDDDDDDDDGDDDYESHRNNAVRRATKRGAATRSRVSDSSNSVRESGEGTREPSTVGYTNTSTSPSTAGGGPSPLWKYSPSVRGSMTYSSVTDEYRSQPSGDYTTSPANLRSSMSGGTRSSGRRRPTLASSFVRTRRSAFGTSYPWADEQARSTSMVIDPSSRTASVNASFQFPFSILKQPSPARNEERSDAFAAAGESSHPFSTSPSSGGLPPLSPQATTINPLMSSSPPTASGPYTSALSAFAAAVSSSGAGNQSNGNVMAPGMYPRMVNVHSGNIPGTASSPSSGGNSGGNSTSGNNANTAGGAFFSSWFRGGNVGARHNQLKSAGIGSHMCVPLIPTMFHEQLSTIESQVMQILMDPGQPFVTLPPESVQDGSDARIPRIVLPLIGMEEYGYTARQVVMRLQQNAAETMARRTEHFKESPSGPSGRRAHVNFKS